MGPMLGNMLPNMGSMLDSCCPKWVPGWSDMVGDPMRIRGGKVRSMLAVLRFEIFL